MRWDDSLSKFALEHFNQESWLDVAQRKLLSVADVCPVLSVSVNPG